MTQIKKTPTRKCTSCGEHFPKNELLRVVRSPEGEISLDKVGKASGRGAYVCKDSACLKKAIKSKALERSLETKIPDEIYDRLEQEMEAEHG